MVGYRSSVLFFSLALATAGCGGGGGGGGGGDSPGSLGLVEASLANVDLAATYPPGSDDVARNVRLVFRFTEAVDPATVNEQTIRIRREPSFASVPSGRFVVDGSTVVFEPSPPFGLEPFTKHTVEVPAFGEQGHGVPIVASLAGRPLVTPHRTTFVTGEGYLRELVAPTVVDVSFVPGPDAAGEVPASAMLAVRFSEPMAPASFVVSTSTPRHSAETVDLRYDCGDPTNVAHDVDCRPIAMAEPTWDPSAEVYYFRPVFSLGSERYRFSVSIGPGVVDLAGNALENPGTYGPFTCDGSGREDGQLLAETFVQTTDRDAAVTDADWGALQPGSLRGAPISSRRVFVAGWQQEEWAEQYGATGTYFPIVDPLIGAALNQAGSTAVVPATSLGRRVMWAFSDVEMGGSGAVSSVAWGPDSNATFGARYPEVVLRLGLQRDASMNLASRFSANYLGAPVLAYQGPYDVSQRANVGNDPLGAPPPGTAPSNPQLQPLYDYAGYVPWPSLDTWFEWDAGDPDVDGDRVLLFDASVAEGNTWQQLRAWFLFPGYPNRRLSSTHLGDDANPVTNPTTGVRNPEPSVADTAFTLTKRTSVAQSRFYTPGPSDPAGNTYPGPHSGARTRGTSSDYLPPVLHPSIQAGGAKALLELQGAQALDPASDRTRVDPSRAFTDWTDRVDDVDGYPYVRWRLTLVSNLNSNTTARVDAVWLPVLTLP